MAVCERLRPIAPQCQLAQPSHWSPVSSPACRSVVNAKFLVLSARAAFTPLFVMSTILIRPLQPSDLPAWKPLWAGYNAFYGR